MSSTKDEVLGRFFSSFVPADEWLKSLERDIAAAEPPKLDLRPVLLLPGNGQSVSEFATALAEKLKDAPIFTRDGIVMEITPTGKLEQIGAEAFCTWIEDYVRLEKWVGVGDERRTEAATMTAAGASLVLASPQFIRQLRSIRRVNQVSQPVIRASGVLELLPKGYDAEARVWTMGSVEYDREMPSDEAITLFDELLKEFPWPREETLKAKSIAITAMVAVFGDMMLDPAHQRPVWIYNANREGSGKTTMLRLAICPSFGSAVISAPPNTTSPDALSKQLFASVLGGVPYLAYDNWSGVIGNSALEAFVTSTTYSDRQLGVSKVIALNKECMVFITGNHARVNPDMRRRSLIVDLEMIEACSEDRKIEKPIGEYEILQMRPQLLAAIWSLIREWDRAGRPEGSKRHPSFSRWGHLFGGIMEHFGLPNPVEAPSKAADDTLRDFTIMVTDALGEWGTHSRTFSAGDLMEFARERGLFSWVLDSEAPEMDMAKRKERASFGKICGRFDGSRFGDIEFARGDDARVGENRAISKQFVIRNVGTIS